MIKRNPVRKAKQSSHKKKNKSVPKIRKDLIKEYQESLTDKGIVEVLSLADDDCLASVRQYISSRSLELDRLLGGRGIPCGRVTEIFGPPHIGKSTILDQLFAEVQSIGGVAVLFDTEGARDALYSGAVGVRINELQYIEFKTNQMHIENVMRKLYDTVEWWHKNAPDMPVVIGWDALGGTATREEMEKRLEKDTSPATAASVLHQAARQIPSKLGNTNVAVVVCNHEYETFGMGKFKSAPRRETYGGSAVRHLASLRVKLYHVGMVQDSQGITIGRKIGIYIEKNRLGNPWGKGEVLLIPGKGIDNIWSIYSKLAEAKLLEIRGSWSAINIDGEILSFQGWPGLLRKCEEDKDLFDKLKLIYKTLE